MANTQPIQLPFLYVNNMQVSYASATTISVAAGQCRDSTNVNDIVVSSAATVNLATNGLNGLDTGSLANTTLYAVYAIADSTGIEPAGFIASANLNGVPYLPFNYDLIRLIGYFRTDGSAQVLTFIIAGNGNARQFFYKNGIKVIENGAATSLTAVSLSGIVPPQDNTPVILSIEFTPNAAGNFAGFTDGNGSQGQIQRLGGTVASVIQWASLKICSSLVSSVPNIQYINSAASCNIDAYIAGFDYFI